MEELEILREILELGEFHNIKFTRIQIKDLSVDILNLGPEKANPKPSTDTSRRENAMKGLPPGYGDPSLGLIDDY